LYGTSNDKKGAEPKIQADGAIRGREKVRCFLFMLHGTSAPLLNLADGSDASRRAIGAVNCHPLSARRLRAWPSSGCSGQPSPRARSRVRQPLIRSAVMP